MDGLVAAAKIKELDISTPIVAVTANIMSNDIELYKNSGMSDYIGKPFKAHDLWKCLMKYLAVVSVTDIDKRSQVVEEAKLQKRLKIDFAKNNQNTFAKFTEKLEKGDYKTAHRMAHTLKSNSGQIGKERLQKAASEVEAALEGEKNALTERQISTLEFELKAVLQELTPILSKEVTTKEIIGIADKKQVWEIIEKLEPLLINKNPDCEDFIDDVRCIQSSERLVEYIYKFKFKQAHDELIKIKKQWGMT
jgi:HPt (histidine-containing phosphotransfer) domain-containing protein